MTLYATTGDDAAGRPPSARRRLVGGALRSCRLQAGYLLADAARLLDCHPSKVSRIETGQRGIRRIELRELLDGYGVGEPEKASLVALARPAAAHAWWREHAGVLAPATAELLSLEAAASEILIWDPHQVPDLLQTPRYSAAAGTALAAVTLARQRAVLQEQQPDLAVVIGEAALRQLPGSPEIRRGQLAALARAAGSSPRITVQVLPSASAAHAAAGGGPVTILGFGGARGPVAVWLAGPGQAGTLVVDQADTVCHALAFTWLARHALPPAETARLLRDLAAE
jgi:hypothetical protein